MNYFINLFFGFALIVSASCNLSFGSDEPQTLADIKLQAIVEAQNKLLEQLQKDPESDNGDKRLGDLLRDYELFIIDNPTYIDADILYGKLLRQVGLTKRAHVVFLTANKKNSNIAVIKQQIGNYLAEQGEYPSALKYFLEAINLEPLIAVYHYQVGELLYRFKSSFLEKGILIPDKMDHQMLNAFHEAAQLEPTSWTYQVRYAEAFYDLETSRWKEALALWKKLESIAPTVLEKELVFLNEARIQIMLKDFEQAKKNLAKVYSVSLEKSRRELLQLIPTLDSKLYFN